MKRLDHVAVAVKDLAEAKAFYEKLGLEAAGCEEVPEQKVRTAFFKGGGTSIELLEPTSPDSPVARFLDKRGPGLHHIAFAVEDLPAEMARLKAAGLRFTEPEPGQGSRGAKVAFLHPACSGGVLVELCQK
ncbi:MAG: methylmalonyl-CoA epimerase [Elusimicrobia bacterium]|nr:methylmalonyl-CoA epimerase [Elusimicrobiota bacterium]